MQRLRSPESGGMVGGEGSPEVQDKGEGGEGRDMGRGSVSHEVMVESVPRGKEEERGVGRANEEVRKAGIGVIPISPSVGVSPTSTAEPLAEQSPTPAILEEVLDVSRGGARKGVRDDARKMPATTATTTTATLGPDKAMPEKKVPSLGVGLDPAKRVDSRSSKVIILEQELASRVDERDKCSPDMPGRRKMATVLSPDPAVETTAPPVEQDRPAQQATERERRLMATSSWCQTQLPEAVAERSLGVGLGGTGDLSPRRSKGGDAGLIGKGSPELGLPRGRQADLGYGVSISPSLGRKSSVSVQEQREVGAVVGTSQYPYSASGGTVFGGLGQGVGVGDWQMDSVIEQIEKQMAAVLEKIEGDMPSLLEQISDCPEQRPKSAHSSPSARSRPRAQCHSTPPPLPTTPRPPLPSLPHLTIPPPSYPPPSPPTLTQAYSQPASGQDDRDTQRGGARPGQSARGGAAGRGV